MLFLAPGTLRFSSEAKADRCVAEMPAGHAELHGREVKVIKDTEIIFSAPRALKKRVKTTLIGFRPR